MKKKYFYITLIIVLSTLTFIIIKISKKHKEMSAITFVYISKNQVDELFKSNYTESKIYDYVISKGKFFQINNDIYDSFFLKNPRVNTRTFKILMNETVKSKIPQDSVVCSIDREVPSFFLNEFENYKTVTGFANFKTFLIQLRDFQIFALLIYSKQNGWFDYDRYKKENDEAMLKLEQLINN